MLPAALFLTLSALPADPPAPAYVLETADVKRVEATLTYTVRCDGVRAREWIVFAARAPELPGQTKVESRLEPGGAAGKELSPLKRPVLVARVAVRQKDMETTLPIRVTYEATLRSRKLKPLAPGATPPRVEALGEREREGALAAHGEIDYKSEAVQAWIKEHKLRRDGDESDVDFARRVFGDIRAGFRYEYKPGADGHASAVCRAGRSDCGGLSGLFVAVMRAGGVPARTLYGRWATSAQAGEKLGEVPYYQAHVKAEFYADGVGWVPVDVASGILHDRSKEGLTYFGNDPGDFLTQHVDPDLEVDTRAFGRQRVSYMQVPGYWVVATGKIEGTTIKEGWEVKKVP